MHWAIILTATTFPKIVLENRVYDLFISVYVEPLWSALIFEPAGAGAVALPISTKIDLRSINWYFSGFSNKNAGSMSTAYPWSLSISVKSITGSFYEFKPKSSRLISLMDGFALNS